MDIDATRIANIDNSIERIANQLEIAGKHLESIRLEATLGMRAGAAAVTSFIESISENPAAFGERIAAGFKRATGMDHCARHQQFEPSCPACESLT